MNDLIKVFTKHNIAILNLLGTEELYIREIAERINCSAATVHQAIKLFEKLEFVKEKRVKNRKVIALNMDNNLLKLLRTMLNTYMVVKSAAYKKLKKHGVIGIYGSFARGEDTKESDLDLWIYSNENVDLLNIRGIIRELERVANKEVKVLILNDKKIEDLKIKDKEFYYRLKLTSIILNGDGDLFES